MQAYLAQTNQIKLNFKKQILLPRALNSTVVTCNASTQCISTVKT